MLAQSLDYCHQCGSHRKIFKSQNALLLNDGDEKRREQDRGTSSRHSDTVREKNSKFHKIENASVIFLPVL